MLESSYKHLYNAMIHIKIMSSIILRKFYDDLNDESKRLMLGLGFNAYTNIKNFYDTDNIICIYYKIHHEHKYAFLTDLYCESCIDLYNSFYMNQCSYNLKQYGDLYRNTCIDIDYLSHHLEDHTYTTDGSIPLQTKSSTRLQNHQLNYQRNRGQFNKPSLSLKATFTYD